MKKNLLSIIILVLLLANIALTAVMMFSVTNTNKKVAGLVTDIATVLKLDLTVPGQEPPEEEISLADTEIYTITGPLTLALAPEVGADGKTRQGYLVCNISVSINTKHADYKKYGSAEEMSAREALIKDVISSKVSQYTATQLQADVGLEGFKAELLKAIQDFFQSQFIYKVAISDVKYG